MSGGATGSSPAGSISWAATEAGLDKGAGEITGSAGGRTRAGSMSGDGLGRTVGGDETEEAGAEETWAGVAGAEAGGTGGDSGNSASGNGSGTRALGLAGAGALGVTGPLTRAGSAIPEAIDGSGTAGAAGGGRADGRALLGGGEVSGNGSCLRDSGLGGAAGCGSTRGRARGSRFAARLAAGFATRGALT